MRYYYRIHHPSAIYVYRDNGQIDHVCIAIFKGPGSLDKARSYIREKNNK